MAKLNLIERYKNLSTADPNLYVHGAFLLPSWYGETARRQEMMWHDFFAGPSSLVAHGDYFHPAVTLHPPAEVSGSNRLSKLYGGESEWFAVQPEAVFQFMSEFIQADRRSKAVLANMQAIESMNP